MKESDAFLRAQINALIRDEIQETVNEYIEDNENSPDSEEEKEPGLGFAVDTMEEKYVKEHEASKKELKVNIPNDEVDKLIKEYKKIKKRQKSNLVQIKKLGLVDKHGRPLNES